MITVKFFNKNKKELGVVTFESFEDYEKKSLDTIKKLNYPMAKYANVFSDTVIGVDGLEMEFDK